jgi:hypothetical protein
MLLSDLFPSDQGFMVCPQHQVDSRNDSVDLVMTYIVESESRVVFFMEVKVPTDVESRSGRALADTQIRQRYEEVYPDVGYALHAVSALGTRLCFYSASPPDGDIEPRAVHRHPHRVNDTAPAGWWNLDVLEPAGETRLRRVAEEVKVVAGSLR